MKKHDIDLPEKTDKTPLIILDHPQLAENVGMVARAMMNSGLYRLRLVNPREDWLCDKAFSASSGAGVILERAGRFDTLEDALTDVQYVVATTARRRDMVKTVLNPSMAAQNFHQRVSADQSCAILFGRERTGLENDAVALCDAIAEIPLNPLHCSLNLAQAVLIMGYEWFKFKNDSPPEQMIGRNNEPATKGELHSFFEHLETALDTKDYFRLEERRPRMTRNLRNIFERGDLTSNEIRALHGVVKTLANPPRNS